MTETEGFHTEHDADIVPDVDGDDVADTIVSYPRNSGPAPSIDPAEEAESTTPME